MPSYRIFAFLTLAILTSALCTVSESPISPRAQQSNKSAFEKREDAYRANNIGVALLEQYKAEEAVESFQRALELKSDLLLARINLAIAFYYLPDAGAAKREAEEALKQNADAAQPHYVLGLIARAQNQFDDAVAQFQKVLKTDPDDVGTNVNLGQIFVQERKTDDAIAAFRRAITAEPYNETALYNLGLLLTRTGKREEGQQLLKKFQQLKASGAGTSIGANYLEGGRYAEAVPSTGLELGLVDQTAPEVTYVDAGQPLLPNAPNGGTRKRRPRSRSENAIMEANARAQAIVLFDYDRDGDLDIFDGAGAQRLLRNDGARFSDATPGSGLSVKDTGYCFAAIAGDYDNDEKPDLFVSCFYDNRFILYHNDGNGHFSDRTAKSKVVQPHPKGPPYASAAFADIDHDGDLDLIIAGPVNILYRNNGDGSFTDVTNEAGITPRKPFGSFSGIIPTDYDNRRDIDLLLVPTAEAPQLFRNMRDGTFRNVAEEVGFANQGPYSVAAAGDINKDGFTDFFLARTVRGNFALSDGRGHFRITAAPVGTRETMAAQFLDYDNDGLLDLVAMTANGLRLWRNVGAGFVDVSQRALPSIFRNLDSHIGVTGIQPGQTALASADVDDDGDVDLVLRGPGGQLRILRNDGGNRNRSVKMDLHGRVSNRSAVQTKVEIRAGSLYQKLETYSASPAPAPADLIFGLGKREKPDAVRVIWPAGIIQSETDFPASRAGLISLNITELDRKPSSCPYLYTWNGDRFEFITDFMGGGEMGYLEEPAVSEPRHSEPGAIPTGSKTQRARYNTPDPDEYVRITSDQLKPREGRYELRVTNELEEALFVDRLQLLAVTHPIGTDVYPNEGMTTVPKSFQLFVTRDARPPVAAVDEHGHDVLDLISRMDRRWPDDFKVERIRGYAEEHSLTMNLAKSQVPSPKSKVVLLLTGWTDYAWSSDNVAATQAGKVMKPPSLQVKDKNGKWRTVIEDIGIPVGRPQTVTVDLAGKFLSDQHEVRIVTNMRVYWDRVLVATSDEQSRIQTTRMDPMKAELRWRGFSAEVSPDGREPFGYDYQKTSFTSPWKTMTGRYTREGDVHELLLNSDDIFAICRPGDEIILSFDATELPSLPTGWTRTFLFYGDGFSKEMDINSASPDQILPLPFHAMSRYPYRWPEQYPLDAKHRDYIEKYNTRVVMSPVPSIVAEMLER
jgi:tetratricopeptide (TPR) repeat protein